MNPETGGAKYQPVISWPFLSRIFTTHTHLFVAGSAWASRIVIALVQLASIRVLMGALGVEQYAMFALLLGLLHWYMLADIGLGISTQNRISECRARELSYGGHVATAGLIAIVLLFVSILVLYNVSPYLAQKFLKAFPNVSDEEKARNFFLTGTLFIAAGIGNISYKIWYAEHRGYLSHILPAAASVLGFIGILILSKSENGNSIYAALLVFNAPSAILAFGSLLLQLVRHADVVKGIRTSLVKGTLSRASKFWLTTVLGTAVLQLDHLVISQVLESHQILIYILCTKVFGFISFFFTSILWALWPSFAESVSRGDWRGLKQSLAKCIRRGMLFVTGATIALVYTMPYITEILAPGQGVHIPTQLVVLMGAYHLLRVIDDAYTVMLQSMNVLWPFWLFVPIQALLCVTFQYQLAPHYGASGIVIGLVASFLLTVIWGLPLTTKREFEKLKVHKLGEQ